MNKKINIETEKDLNEILNYFNEFYSVQSVPDKDDMISYLNDDNENIILIVSYEEDNEVKIDYCSYDKDINIKEYCNSCGGGTCTNYKVTEGKDFI